MDSEISKNIQICCTDQRVNFSQSTCEPFPNSVETQWDRNSKTSKIITRQYKTRNLEKSGQFFFNEKIQKVEMKPFTQQTNHESFNTSVLMSYHSCQKAWKSKPIYL